MRIQHNIMAMNAYRNYTNNANALSLNLEKLSSGYRINRAGDDAAGLAISEKMRAQITGLDAAQKNVQDGISLVKTAEGALQEVQDMLNRMVYLATQSANGTYEDEVDREALQSEVNQLRSEIDRIADSANFNGRKLLDGTLGLNTDAFSFSTAAAVEDFDGVFEASDLNYSGFHAEQASDTATAAKFTVDLTGVNLDHANYDTTNDDGNESTITISFAGQSVDVDLTAVASNAETDHNATAIETALIAAIKADSNLGALKTGDTTASALNLGGYVFDMDTTADGKLEFTLVGTTTDATDASAYKTLADKPITTTDATTINGLVGTPVSVTLKTAASGAGTATLTGNTIHSTTNVTQAVAKVDASLAGITLQLTEDMVVNGGTFEIDGNKYYFHTEGDDPNVAGYTKIDLTKAKTKTEAIHMAVDELSKKGELGGTDGRKWVISSAGGDTIHIDMTDGSDTASKMVKTQTAMTDLIKVVGKATSAASAGVIVTADENAIVDGNALTIDGTQYVFTDDKDLLGNDTDTVKYVDITDKTQAMENLKTALGSDYMTELNTAGDALTIRKAGADSDAPSVLGKGLTLQIGDTSDDYNQLGVLVKDMHTASLGVDVVDITNADGAAKAINIIKDAINAVSSQRGDLGAIQNRLEHTANNLSVMEENITNAESAIRDTDIADEMTAYTKNNILLQSAQAMLAQANQVPQGVLQLLQ